MSPTDAAPSDVEYYAEDAATFGDRLAAARDVSGLSQSDLSRRLGVLPKVIRNWEDDRSEPRANKLQMLAGILNVSMSWLITGQGDGVEELQNDEPAAAKEILSELRALRAESNRMTTRIGRLEKQLRGML